ncbi:unnamed protein product [Rangifer tarandus platyrhynchus]|uniref:Uncharacterized protein n=2 Tax=Rangifer tarandus platyrhynchus TaxID=3082113 RepID=A0ABN8XY18_RANTA|nr:unnamed protein product [Rangifer tarandus platyrhynchus]
MSTLVEQLSARQSFSNRLPPPWMPLLGCSPPKGSSASGRQVEGGSEVHREASNGSGWKTELLPSAHVVQKAGDGLSCVSQRRTLVWQTADLCHTPLGRASP